MREEGGGGRIGSTLVEIGGSRLRLGVHGLELRGQGMGVTDYGVRAAHMWCTREQRGGLLEL